jgi:1-deoxy-D-xylulose-5-phosphate reductoisomerase
MRRSDNGATLLPIDSEHNAIFQCLPPIAIATGCRLRRRAHPAHRLRRTPSATRTADALAAVTPEQACAHPNWSMGRKISVDSATMMNKGLEIIEACWLFDTSPERIQVVVHRQSVIHSMVQYTDGSVLAQLGNPDMRTPIAHALGWPERIDAGVAPLDLFEIARLDFEPPAPDRFPLSAPGLSRRGRGRHGARRAECRQRGRRGRLPGTGASASPTSPGSSSTRWTALPAEPVDLSGLEHVLGVDAAARRAAEQCVAPWSHSAP